MIGSITNKRAAIVPTLIPHRTRKRRPRPADSLFAHPSPGHVHNMFLILRRKNGTRCGPVNVTAGPLKPAAHGREHRSKQFYTYNFRILTKLRTIRTGYFQPHANMFTDCSLNVPNVCPNRPACSCRPLRAMFPAAHTAGPSQDAPPLATKKAAPRQGGGPWSAPAEEGGISPLRRP